MKIESEKGKTFDYHIVLIGSGATGSQLLPFLTQLLNNINQPIKIVDGDIFEAKNMKNQKCLERDLGKAKAEVLCERYQGAYPAIDISYVDEYVKDKQQIINLLMSQGRIGKTIPILVGCVDNNATRKIFNDVFYDDSLPDLIYIDSGNGTTDRRGQVVTGLKIGETKQVPPYETWQQGRLPLNVVWEPVSSFFPEILTDEEELDKLLSCSHVSNESPQNIATNVMAAATIFCILNNIITFDKLTSHISYFDAEKVEIVTRKGDVEHERRNYDGETGQISCD